MALIQFRTPEGGDEEMFLSAKITINGPVELEVDGLTTFSENGIQMHHSGRITIAKGRKVVII